MKRVKRFGIWQTAKVAAVIYFILSAIFVIPIWLFSSLFSAFLPEESGLSGAFLLLLPFFYAFFGFVAVAIGCAIYNIVSGWIGGIEVEIEEHDGNAAVYAHTTTPPQS